VEGPDSFHRSGEKQTVIEKFEIPILQRQARIRNVDTDFHRCTQIQKPMNPIACGDKKQANFFLQKCYTTHSAARRT
jgi:hypothetical protein